MSLTPTTASLITELRDRIRGHVIGPDDSDYDQARTVTMGGIDRHPAAIARVADAHDVAQVIAIARETDVELAVRSGGHSSAGHSVTEGGVVLDLHDMKAADFDLDAGTVWAQTGLTAGELTAAAADHGLAIGFGDTGSVGIGGITLGGGVGYLGRKFGLTIDSVLAAEIVTADGQVLQVSEDEHPDLFWALRGGGGNFGVVTRFKYRLHPLPAFYGGMLLLPATAETVAGFVAAAEAAPEELSTIGNVMPTPPMPFVPEEWHGKLAIMGMLGYAGDAEAGAKAVAPFRALAEPIADMVRPMGYPEIYPPEDESYHPLAVAHTLFVDRVDLPVAQTIMQWLNGSDAAMRVAQLRVLGGAIARVPADATAYAHRSEPILVNVAAFYEGPQDKPLRQAWVDGFRDALRGENHAAYVNFVGDEGESRVHDAYPAASWERLARVKAEYDPENRFRLNQNVPPA